MGGKRICRVINVAGNQWRRDQLGFLGSILKVFQKETIVDSKCWWGQIRHGDYSIACNEMVLMFAIIQDKPCLARAQHKNDRFCQLFFD